MELLHWSERPTALALASLMRRSCSLSKLRPAA
jgi:hypothetical protein